MQNRVAEKRITVGLAKNTSSSVDEYVPPRRREERPEVAKYRMHSWHVASFFSSD